VDLSWNPSTSAVTGYNVYRSTQANGAYSRINSVALTQTAFTDFQVQSATTYYYATTAVDANGFESGYSNVTQGVVP
jgi:fibronectin type 3 domain-containing protein